MKNQTIKWAAIMFASFFVFSGCKKEKVTRDIQVQIDLQTTAQQSTRVFAQGEDIVFVFIEKNSMNIPVEFVRKTNFPPRMFSVFDENNKLVGSPVDPKAPETLELDVITLNPSETEQSSVNWLNTTRGNSPLPAGQYKAVYESSYQIWENDAVPPEKEFKLELDFVVQ